jgi:hypothetical protein
MAGDIKNGVPAAEAGGLFLQRLKGLYMAVGADGKFSLGGVSTTFNGQPIQYGPLFGYGALVAGVVIKWAGRKTGMDKIKLFDGVMLI